MSIFVGKRVEKRMYADMSLSHGDFRETYPGTVVYIDKKRKYYMVEFDSGIRECYPCLDCQRKAPEPELSENGNPRRYTYARKYSNKALDKPAIAPVTHRVTQQDVAEKAGVDKATVLRYLRKQRCHARLEKKIAAAIEELGFVIPEKYK